MDRSSSSDDDDGSTILIESEEEDEEEADDEDSEDSDATHISVSGSESDNEPEPVRTGADQPQAASAQAASSRLPALPTLPGASQSLPDSESLLMVPPGTRTNQSEPVQTGSDQPHAAIQARDDLPGPSGMQNLGHGISGGRETDQSGARLPSHATEGRTTSQSETRDGTETAADGTARTMRTLLQRLLTTAEGSNEMRAVPANQDAEGRGNEEEEEESMETDSVIGQEDSSNDSMIDFQERKKLVEPETATKEEHGSCSDDEAQSCIICYESWTTSGSHRLVSLRCGHLFGQSCIEQWLKGQGGKCPQCNCKAKKGDIRVIYAKALKALDTSDRDRALKELEKEKELRRRAEMDAAQTQLRYVMAMEEVKRMKSILEAQQKSAARNTFASNSSSHQQLSQDQLLGKYVLERTIQVSASGNCRVLAFDPANQLLLASMPSQNNLFQGYGFKKISAMDFKTSQYISIHSKPIRGVAFNGRDDGLVLSCSMDKNLKITSLASNTVVQSYSCPLPAWCCAWNSANTNYVYAGLQNGSIIVFDTRKSDGEVQTLTREGSRCPIVSLKYVPSSPMVSFPCAGLLTGTLEGASFWEQTAAEEYRLHNLQLEGSCTGVAFATSTRNCLASFRPSKSHPSTRYVMCEMARQQVGEHGNSLVSSQTVQTFYGGNTMKVLTQSALFPIPGQEGNLIVCAGDESSSSVYLWDASTAAVRQKIPMGATAIDVCPFNVGETHYLAALTDKQIKLCKWVPRS